MTFQNPALLSSQAKKHLTWWTPKSELF